jgi:triosephosphate isomerase
VNPTVGVSLKMYFGHRQAVDWCRTAARVAARHPAVAEGRLDVFVAPSFPVLPAAVELFAGTGVRVAAQDLAAQDRGAYTGEVSGAELAEIGVGLVEVGHAERRRLFGEDEATVAAKTAAAVRNGLVPVLCLGEGDRQPADAAATECVRQLASALNALTPRQRPDDPDTTNDPATRGDVPIVVAYEPHWAIGAAEPAGADHVVPVCRALGSALGELDAPPGSRVIYGGSAGPGLLDRLGDSVAGLFLGRFAHDPEAFDQVLAEAADLVADRGSGH